LPIGPGIRGGCAFAFHAVENTVSDRPRTFCPYLCGVAGAFFAGIFGALAATVLHADTHATTLIVKILSTVFFSGFALLAWVIIHAAERANWPEEATPPEASDQQRKKRRFLAVGRFEPSAPARHSILIKTE